MEERGGLAPPFPWVLELVCGSVVHSFHKSSWLVGLEGKWNLASQYPHLARGPLLAVGPPLSGPEAACHCKLRCLGLEAPVVPYEDLTVLV